VPTQDDTLAFFNDDGVVFEAALLLEVVGDGVGVVVDG